MERAIGRFMNRDRGLNSETLGRILDKLGCTLTPVINRYAPKPVGRPRKYYAHEVEMKGAFESAKIKTGEMVIEGIRDYEEKADESSLRAFLPWPRRELPRPGPVLDRQGWLLY